ncbi:MAG: DOMON-like domain-containing protein [Hyphomonadaceae bacterium]
MRRALILHPDSRCTAVRDIAVEVTRSGAHGLVLHYAVRGAVDDIVWPAPSTPERADGLWKQTCFEAFVGTGDVGYAEFNFAPSRLWAAYRFDNYRAGMSPLEGVTPRIETSRDPGCFELRAELAALAPGSLRLGLSAVIEEIGGAKSYWALAHTPGAPDFHHPDSFVLETS